MIRLSCPHLVKAIDQYEDNGGIQKFNTLLQQLDKPEGLDLSLNFLETNKAWQLIRMDALKDGDKEYIASYLGEEGAKHLMDSGIIGITAEKVDDVKCLHAHVADELLRGSNTIGKQTLEALLNSGVDPSGCEGKSPVRAQSVSG